MNYQALLNASTAVSNTIRSTCGKWKSKRLFSLSLYSDKTVLFTTIQINPWLAFKFFLKRRNQTVCVLIHLIQINTPIQQTLRSSIHKQYWLKAIWCLCMACSNCTRMYSKSTLASEPSVRGSSIDSAYFLKPKVSQRLGYLLMNSHTHTEYDCGHLCVQNRSLVIRRVFRCGFVRTIPYGASLSKKYHMKYIM